VTQQPNQFGAHASKEAAMNPITRHHPASTRTPAPAISAS
jgi:hypothetical protein